MRYWNDFALAYRNIIRQKRRSIITLSAVSFGITALILASGFIEWIFYDFREGTIKSQLGHLQIVYPGYHQSGKADPYAFLLQNAPPNLSNLDDEPDRIKIIVPRLSFSGLINHGESTLSFIGDAIDPQEQLVFGDALQISKGKHLSADHPLSIIAGEGLARNLGLEIDDQVVLLVNTESGGINAIEVIIRGIFSTVTKSYDDNAIRIPIETARKLLRTEGTHSWVVLLNDTEQTDYILSLLRESLPQNKYEVVPWYALADFYNKTVVLFTKQVTGIKIIIALIILLSIFNTLNISVIERIGEIGTAMALGVNRLGIIRIFLSEGVMLGCLGAMIGLVIGLLLATIISEIGIQMPPPPGMARGYIGRVLVTFDIVYESLFLALGTTLIASIYPAWKASRLQIVDALRHYR